MHRLSMLLLVTLGGLASAAGLATFDIAVAATAPDQSTGSRRDHATLHCDDGRPDIIPEHRIVRDPLTCKFYQLSPEEFRHFEAPAPRPEATNPDDLFPKSSDSLIYSAEHRIIRNPLDGGYYQLSPEEFRHFEPPAPRPEATTPDDLLPKNDNGRVYSKHVYSVEARIVRDPVTGSLWQLSPEEFRHFERPEPRPEPTLPGIQPEPDEPERLALGPLTLEGKQLSVDWRAGATNGVPPGQGESVSPIESRPGSGTIGRSRIGAGAASTLPVTLMATILGYGISRLFFRRRIAPGVVLGAFLSCWAIATSLHVLIGARFFSDPPNLLVLTAFMAAIAAVVMELLAEKNAGKEKSVPPSAKSSLVAEYATRQGEVSTPSFPSGVDDEDAMYEKAWAEITAGSPKAAIWARAYAESDGDDSKTRAAYIRLRVSELNANRISND